jgi:hypothetical protein
MTLAFGLYSKQAEGTKKPGNARLIVAYLV